MEELVRTNKNYPKRSKVSSAQKESHENYGAIIAHSNNWRVIACRDGIQWIIQKGVLSSHGRVWRGKSYCCTKKALLRNWTRLSGLCVPHKLLLLYENIVLSPTNSQQEAQAKQPLHAANDRICKAAA
ncbi:hypothetical protein [Polycladidibacter stylochi]|uniref:hypothetical protein n=1 Tax=Polycladidibacter stylochi TaxID=1807766 RepID=UPI000834C3E8|nr:hypothetical protein [Pseudovibrio stylochi]